LKKKKNPATNLCEMHKNRLAFFVVSIVDEMKDLMV